LSIANTGKKASADTLIKMSIAGKNISDETRRKMSDSKKGSILSVEVKSKISAAHKGRIFKTAECPHCNKSGRINNMTRYHFNNCKLKYQ